MRLAAWALIGAVMTAPAQAQDSPGPIAIHGNKQTFEIAPVLYAASEFYPDRATVKMGGIPNLVGEPVVPGFGEEGVADLATHAETQALRYSVRHPDLRIVLTVTEGLYRIVARKSAGIAQVADLKGKRIATIPQTSAGYFLQRMLERAGLGIADVTPVPLNPLSKMTEALKNREVDAVVIWEPESENSARALGQDLIEFSGEGVYRELFNLNTTAANLADPAQRAKVVAFVRATIQATQEIAGFDDRAKQLVVEEGGFTPEEVARSWKHHRFIADLPPDLLDVLEAEEQWLAAQDKRPARSRAQLATLIDASVYAEARAE